MPIVYAVPFFGALCLLCRVRTERKCELGKRAIGLEKDSIMKGRFKKIQVEDNDDLQVVPLEEALLVNNAKVRHSLMLNILHKNPNEYLEILQRASNSNDMEVTHYATTMMMEILTEYEKNIQKYDIDYKKNGDVEILKEYILYLDEFIKSKLISGNIEIIYRRRLADLIAEYARKKDNIGKIIFINIENNLMLGENQKAFELLETAKEKYSYDERIYRLYGHYYDNVRDYNSLKEMISEIKQKNMYFSKAGREWLTFWEN